MKKYTLAIAATLLLGLGATAAPLLAKEPGTESIAADARASDVAVSTSSVEMTYPIKARLFGVLPIALPARIMVASDGSIQVRYPWYSFFFSTDQAELQTKLKAVGEAARAWRAEVLTEQQQATLLTLVHAALQSNLNSSSTASSASVQ